MFLVVTPSGRRSMIPILRHVLSQQFSSSPKSYKQLSALRDRGVVHQTFPSENPRLLAAHLAKERRTIYAGFDPTADSLHLGNLLVLVTLLRLKRDYGHRAVILLGGATASIGDPSGKAKERPAMDASVVKENLKGVERDIRNVLENYKKLFGEKDKDNEDETLLLDNMEWFKDTKLLDFLSGIGRHFRVGPMLNRKSVRERFKSIQGLSLTEFTYQMFQACDWLRLYDQLGCTVQLGGSDQISNIAAGHDLIQWSRGDGETYGLMVPLILSETKEKLGKTAGSALWLSPEKTSQFDFYQYFMRVADADVERLINLFTFLPMTEIRDLMRKHSQKPEKRTAQQKLAELVTRLVHGEDGLELAVKTTNVLYGSGDTVQTLSGLSLEEMRSMFRQASYVRLLYDASLCMLDFAMKVGCFRTEQDALRIMVAGGFYVNQVRMGNPEEMLVPGLHLLPNNTSLVRVGKKHYYIVEWMV